MTRWREDATRDCWGQFCYVRDLSDGTVWSVGHQPLCRAADEYEVAFHADRAEFRRRDGDVETRWAVCVAPDHDAEVRVVTLVNHGGRPRDFDLTSYAEVCLNHRRADQAHPAFAKLFLETEFVPGQRLPAGPPPAAGRGPEAGLGRPRLGGGRRGERTLEYETDRARFLGRGRTPANPAALDRGARLSGRPARCWTRSSACGGGSASTGGDGRVAFVTGAAETREAALALAEQFRDLEAVDRAFAAARTRCQDELQELGLTPDDVALFNRLAGAVVFTEPRRCGSRTPSPPTAWGSRACGRTPSPATCPIVLVRVAAAGRRVRSSASSCSGTPTPAAAAWTWTWSILDERAGDAAERLETDLQAGAAGELLGKPGGRVRPGRGSGLGRRRGAAGGRGPGRPRRRTRLAGRAARPPTGRGDLPPPLPRPSRPIATEAAAQAASAARGLAVLERPRRFTPDGREYVIVIDGTAPAGRPCRRPRGPTCWPTPASAAW